METTDDKRSRQLGRRMGSDYVSSQDTKTNVLQLFNLSPSALIGSLDLIQMRVNFYSKVLECAASFNAYKFKKY